MSSAGAKSVIQAGQIQDLIRLIGGLGYTVIGPTVTDGTIVYDELSCMDDLPIGWTDEQDAGIYRLHRRDDGALFGYVVGAHSWRKFLHPSRLRCFFRRQELRSACDCNSGQSLAGIRSSR